MTRRWLGRFGFASFALILVIGLEPTRIVWGWLAGESFFQGRPTSYWAREVASWNPTLMFA